MPEFQKRIKQDFIFQCSNHYPQIQSAILANLCRKYKVSGIFAGPIAENYRKEFFNSIDNIHTFYLGVISEQEKIKYLSNACMFGAIYDFFINETPLALKQALSYNCSILTTGAGHLKETIKNGYNGFYIHDEKDFPSIWDDRNKIEQINCYNSIQGYNVHNMIKSFKEVIEKI